MNECLHKQHTTSFLSCACFLPKLLCRFGFLVRFPTKATAHLCTLTLFDWIRGVMALRPFNFCTMIWLITSETCEHTQHYKPLMKHQVKCTHT